MSTQIFILVFTSMFIYYYCY